MVAQCLGAKSLTGPAGWSMWPCACPWRLRRCSFWGLNSWPRRFCRCFTPDQGTMEIAVRNLRIEILGQIFYASFMVYNALPMGGGAYHVCLGVQPAQLHCGPGDPGPDFEPFLWPGGNFSGPAPSRRPPRCPWGTSMNGLGSGGGPWCRERNPKGVGCVSEGERCQKDRTAIKRCTF